MTSTAFAHARNNDNGGATPERRERMAKSKPDMGSMLKGNTGEFYALAELSRKGWTAAQTARNTRAYDILARKGTRQVALRVKTKTSDARGFRWNAKKDGTIFHDQGRDDYCILVDIPEDGHPTFYIVPTKEIHDWLVADFKTWRDTSGIRKPERSADNARHLIYMDEDTTKPGHGYKAKLQPYFGKWTILD
jgi:hypothetical protein